MCILPGALFPFTLKGKDIGAQQGERERERDRERQRKREIDRQNERVSCYSAKQILMYKSVIFPFVDCILGCNASAGFFFWADAFSSDLDGVFSQHLVQCDQRTHF